MAPLLTDSVASPRNGKPCREIKVRIRSKQLRGCTLQRPIRASRVAEETGVQSLVREDRTCPEQLSLCAATTELVL